MGHVASFPDKILLWSKRTQLTVENDFKCILLAIHDFEFFFTFSHHGDICLWSWRGSKWAPAVPQYLLGLKALPTTLPVGMLTCFPCALGWALATFFLVLWGGHSRHISRQRDLFSGPPIFLFVRLRGFITFKFFQTTESMPHCCVLVEWKTVVSVPACCPVLLAGLSVCLW